MQVVDYEYEIKCYRTIPSKNAGENHCYNSNLRNNLASYVQGKYIKQYHKLYKEVVEAHHYLVLLIMVLFNTFGMQR